MTQNFIRSGLIGIFTVCIAASALGQNAPAKSDSSGNWGALFKSQMDRCWKKPRPKNADVRVEVSFAIRLNRDGTLAERPASSVRDSSDDTKAYQQSAMDAVLSCQPYNLPAEKYAEWRYFAPVFRDTLRPQSPETGSTLGEAEQVARPQKNDIRGFFPGMSFGKFDARLTAMGVRTCLPGDTYPDGPYPCTRKDKFTKRLSLYLSRDEHMSFVVTENLADNKIVEVFLFFRSLKSSDQISATVKEQYGISSPPSTQGWEIYDGSKLAIGYHSDGFSVRIWNDQLDALDKKAKEDMIRRLPNPKF